MRSIAFALSISALLAVSACKSTAPADGPLPGGGYSYLVVPSGQMFRVLASGPVTGAGGQKIGTMIKYAGDTKIVTELMANAEALIAAMGPEEEAAGETSVIISAEVGYDPRGAPGRSVAFNLPFALRLGKWTPLPSREEARELAVDSAKVAPPEDPSFRFDPSMMKAGTEAAAKFLALLDAGETDASLALMTGGFRQQAAAMWPELVTKLAPLQPGARTELYRLQSRKGNVVYPPEGAVTVQYEFTNPLGARLLERAAMANGPHGWLAAGAAFQPLARKQ